MKEHRHVQTARGPAGEEKEQQHRTFSLNRPSHQKDFPRSDARVESRAIDLSRARRRTHGTPRTSRTSRDAYTKLYSAKTSNSEIEFPVGGLRFAPDLHPQPPTL